MRNPLIVSFSRPAIAVLALITSLGAHAADSNSLNEQTPATSLLDQLFSPPAPLRDSASVNNVADEITQRVNHLFTMSGNDAVTGERRQFAITGPANTGASTATVNGLQQFSSAFFDKALSRQTALTAQTRTSEQLAFMQSVDSLATNLMALPATQRNNEFMQNANPMLDPNGNRQLGQWLANAARYTDKLKISAELPLDATFMSQAPTETVMAAINSKEVTEHLEQHSESVSLLAQLLGWQKTGLLPSATDLQKMAANHVGAVTSSVERWALQNVSFSATSHAITNSNTQEQMLQWQWSAASNSQYNNNSVADNEANFSANLRRLFGMNDYY